MRFFALVALVVMIGGCATSQYDEKCQAGDSRSCFAKAWIGNTVHRLKPDDMIASKVTDAEFNTLALKSCKAGYGFACKFVPAKAQISVKTYEDMCKKNDIIGCNKWSYTFEKADKALGTKMCGNEKIPQLPELPAYIPATASMYNQLGPAFECFEWQERFIAYREFCERMMDVTIKVDYPEACKPRQEYYQVRSLQKENF